MKTSTRLRRDLRKLDEKLALHERIFVILPDASPEIVPTFRRICRLSQAFEADDGPKVGLGPVVMRAKGRRLISVEVTEWRRAMERQPTEVAAHAQAAPQVPRL
jgi:hypothetical protein